MTSARTVVLLVMHGIPPRDFPPQELSEFFMLHTRLERATGTERDHMLERYSALESKMRGWPRTPQNDPFFAASQEMAAGLSKATGYEVATAYNEFCAPDVEEALTQVAARGAGQIIALTPMLTQGGEHADVEIPALLKEFQAAHPSVSVVYAWPFDTAHVAKFLAEQVKRFVK